MGIDECPVPVYFSLVVSPILQHETSTGAWSTEHLCREEWHRAMHSVL